ncbi:uncharacterized protein VTP21DRAFT_10703 [Calcarisporiella thermophila]|uniref:uncharacterized protein n=1 Tax=Calcarisporiella thermophila TaxID=911321 RepID=UPI0037440D63
MKDTELDLSSPRLLYEIARAIEAKGAARTYLKEDEHAKFREALEGGFDAWWEFFISPEIFDSTTSSTKPSETNGPITTELDSLASADTVRDATNARPISHQPVTSQSNVTILASYRMRSMMFEQLLPCIYPSYRSCCKPVVDVEQIYERLKFSDSMPKNESRTGELDKDQVKEVTVRGEVSEDYDEEEQTDEQTQAQPVESDTTSKPQAKRNSEVEIPLNDAYHTFELDRQSMIALQKLQEAEMQEQEEAANEKSGQQDSKSLSNLGLGGSSMKYLLSVIDQNRNETCLSDRELRHLLTDLRVKRSKWASDDKIGQEELYDAAERVLIELRNYTEHSTPFLTKVKKSDAPDYYSVIKHPMDLGTMMKKLKNFQYKSKKEITDDLFLIFSNCLEYNTHPASPFRRHAIAMQQRASQLVHEIPDIVVRDRAELEAEEEQDAEDETDDENRSEASKDRSLGLRVRGSKGNVKGGTKSSKGPARSSNKVVSEIIDSEHGGAGSQEPSTREPSVAPSADMTPHLNGTAQVASKKNAEAKMLDLDQEEVALDIEIDAGDLRTQVWAEKTKEERGRICLERDKEFRVPFPEQSALIRTAEAMQLFQEAEAVHDEPYAPKSASNATFGFPGMERDDVFFDERREKRTAKSDSIFLPEYHLMSSIPELRQDPSLPLKTEPYHLFDDDFVYQLEQERPSLALYPEAHFPNHGASALINANIEELKAIRDLYGKIIATKNNIPLGSLNEASTDEKEKETDLAPLPIEKDSSLPPLNMNGNTGFHLMEKVTTKLLQHAGFDSSNASALHVLTDVAVDYMMNLGKTIRMYSDLYNKKMSAEEIILHSLYENGITSIRALDSYVTDEVGRRYGKKLQDIRQRLDSSYRELINQPMEVQPVDEDLILDNDDFFTSGTLGEEIGEDILGLRELVGIDSFAIPSKLWYGSGRSMAVKVPTGGPRGKPLPYPPPPPFPPVTDPESQIGLLRDYFQKKLEENNGKLIEDEYMPAKFRIRPRIPPTATKALATKKKEKELAAALEAKKKKKAEMEAAAAEKKKQRAEAKAARIAEREERKKIKEEIRERQREAKAAARAMKKRKASFSESDRLQQQSIEGNVLLSMGAEGKDDDSLSPPISRRVSSSTDLGEGIVVESRGTVGRPRKDGSTPKKKAQGATLGGTSQQSASGSSGMNLPHTPNLDELMPPPPTAATPSKKRKSEGPTGDTPTKKTKKVKASKKKPPSD